MFEFKVTVHYVQGKTPSVNFLEVTVTLFALLSCETSHASTTDRIRYTKWFSFAVTVPCTPYRTERSPMIFSTSCEFKIWLRKCLLIELMTHNWQNLITVFLSCYCYEISRVGADSLQIPFILKNYTFCEYVKFGVNFWKTNFFPTAA